VTKPETILSFLWLGNVYPTVSAYEQFAIFQRSWTKLKKQKVWSASAKLFVLHI
jgi:hypothetical protein